MSLKSLRTDFHREPGEDEGFHSDKQGRTDTGRQTRRGAGGRIDINDRFSLKDRTVVTHPKTLRTLEQRLKNGRHDFNILLLEEKRPSRPGESGHQRLLDYRRQTEEFMRENGIPTEGRITFVKNGTTGHVLTPWMVLHTLGHALALEDRAVEEKIIKYVDEIRRNLDGFMREFPHLDHPGTPSWVKRRRETLGSVFVFRSASDEGDHNSAANLSEFVHELVADFLWNADRIRIRPPHDKDETVTGLVKLIEREIDTLLGKCTGKIIFDHN